MGQRKPFVSLWNKELLLIFANISGTEFSKNPDNRSETDTKFYEAFNVFSATKENLLQKSW
jgi:hypothetical protein